MAVDSSHYKENRYTIIVKQQLLSDRYPAKVRLIQVFYFPERFHVTDSIRMGVWDLILGGLYYPNYEVMCKKKIRFYDIGLE